MLSTSAELARSALDAAPDAMVIIDASGAIRFANRQVSVLFGHAHDDLIGQSIEGLLPERFRVRHVAHREGFVSNVRVRPMGAGLDLFGLRHDGSEFPVEISLSPIDAAGEKLVAAAIRDATARKQAEADLIAAREVADAARALAIQARDAADRANQGKSRFLAAASHDLRQPLQTLALLNGALLRSVRDPDVAAALQQQEQAIAGVARLLNALLDISKLESGVIKPELADFAVSQVFEGLRGEFATIAASKGLALEVEGCRDTVRSDPTLVEEILRNLLSNAIKYTRAGGVRLRCLHESSLVRIEVLDTGIGIPADELPYISDEFYQVGVSSNSTRDGYGLGLSIVQRLVKLLALQLDVRSEVGKGSAFSLTMPAVDRLSATAPSQSGRHSPIQGPQVGTTRVVLVEDDAAVRAATHMLLRVEGYSVSAYASREEALQHVRDGKGIDLLISDYHLGGGETGTQVIAALREALGAPLKALIMTGDTSTAISELPRDPFLRVASKPIVAEELLTLLRALLAA